jgi:hypothetical protein
MECAMNGYQDRVRRHRRELAEAAAKREENAGQGMDWVAECVEGVAHALESVRPPHRRKAAVKDEPGR